MHGRILYYNDVTGTGTIANLHRRLFEFTKQSWHDRKSLPQREMLVDFRLDEHGKVTDCRESNFKRLQKSYPISEDDFWATADDSKLEERSNEVKEALILQGIHTLDPAKPIPLTLPMDRCFDLFFSEELEMLARYEELFANESSYRFVDYVKLKPFLQKAKAHLLSLDPSIGHEPFWEVEQDICRVEALLERLEWVFRLESRVLFEEMFLKHQIVYLRAKRRLALELERVSQLEARAKKIPLDLEARKSLRLFIIRESRGGFNAFSFLSYYLKPLDKNHLSPQDRELYRYWCEYEAKEAIKFLVVSEDAEFAMMLKRCLLGAHKDVLVYAFSRGVDSMPYIQRVSVHAALVDAEIRSMKIEERLEFFKQHTPSPDAKIFGWVLGFGDAREESLKNHGCLSLKKSLGEEKLAKMLERLLPTLKKG